MALFLFLLFVGIPILEIALFIQIGGFLGLWTTIAVVILTAAIGTVLVRSQGLATMMKAQSSLNAGQMPLTELFDGACILVAGLLLLTPGFFTDGIGFLLLLPPFRIALRKILAARISVQPDPFRQQGHAHPSGNANPHTAQTHPFRSQTQNTGPVIDGDFKDLSEAKTEAEPRPATGTSPLETGDEPSKNQPEKKPPSTSS